MGQEETDSEEEEAPQRKRGRKIPAKKGIKRRRLNDLDCYEEDDDGSDEDFMGDSSSEEEESEEEESEEDSYSTEEESDYSDVIGPSKRSTRNMPTRRSARN